MPLLIESLRALRLAFPALPATLFTENARRRARDADGGDARLAIYPIFGGPPRDVAAEFLARVALAPVAAADHPLASSAAPLRARIWSRMSSSC